MVTGDIFLGSREADFELRFICLRASRTSMIEPRIRFLRRGWRKIMLSEGKMKDSRREFFKKAAISGAGVAVGSLVVPQATRRLRLA